MLTSYIRHSGVRAAEPGAGRHTVRGQDVLKVGVAEVGPQLRVGSGEAEGHADCTDRGVQAQLPRRLSCGAATQTEGAFASSMLCFTLTNMSSIGGKPIVSTREWFNRVTVQPDYPVLVSRQSTPSYRPSRCALAGQTLHPCMARARAGGGDKGTARNHSCNSRRYPCQQRNAARLPPSCPVQSFAACCVHAAP